MTYTFKPRVSVIEMQHQFNGTPESVEALNKESINKARMFAIQKGGIDFAPVEILNVNSTEKKPIWDIVEVNVATGDIRPITEDNEKVTK
jgi:hypothetical protein